MINKLILCIMISFFALVASEPADAMFYPWDECPEFADQEKEILVVPLSLEGLPDEIFLLVSSYLIDLKKIAALSVDLQKEHILNLTNLMETSKLLHGKIVKLVFPPLLHNYNQLNLQLLPGLTNNELSLMFKEVILRQKTFSQKINQQIEMIQQSVRKMPRDKTGWGRDKHCALFCLVAGGSQCILIPLMFCAICWTSFNLDSCTSFQDCKISIRQDISDTLWIVYESCIFIVYAAATFFANDQIEKWMRDPNQNLDT